MVCESPVLLAAFYAFRMFCPAWDHLSHIERVFGDRYPSLDLLLTRSSDEEYRSTGRFHDVEEAAGIDGALSEFLTEHGVKPIKVAPLDHEQLRDIVLKHVGTEYHPK